jgi:hypothetical protein
MEATAAVHGTAPRGACRGSAQESLQLGIWEKILASILRRVEGPASLEQVLRSERAPPA